MAKYVTVIGAANAALVPAVSKIYVGATGDVVVHMKSDANTSNFVTFKAVPVGTFLDITVDKVFSTSTANSMLGLY